MHFSYIYQNSRFPEDLYLIDKEYQKDYQLRVIHGYEIMDRSSVTIGMLCRNNGHVLVHTICRSRFLGSMFNKCNIVVYENDSNDGFTKEFLSQLKNIDLTSVDLKLPENEQDHSFGRRVRMAYYRNECRKQMCKYDTDYYIVLDSDVLGGFSYEGIAHSISLNQDIVASNSLIYDNRGKDGAQRRLYYDAWAWRDLGHEEPHKDSDINLRVFHRGEPPVTVLSAFGGLCIYKNHVFKNLKYKYDETDCDHVTLHKQMVKDDVKIVMNPSQIVLYNKTRYTLC